VTNRDSFYGIFSMVGTQSREGAEVIVDVRINDIDSIIKNAISVMEQSRYQIFAIAESARQELLSLRQELERVKKETSETIDKVDELEREFRRARMRLVEVSKDFIRYKEADIKSAYEKATRIQLDLLMYREKEYYLKARRDELQQRIKTVEVSVERAETISSQINVVLEYLSGDLNQVTRILESAKNRQLIGLKIILAQEEERKRMAREIHDGPAQSLANLVLRTEIAERMLVKQEFQLVQEELMELKSQVRSGLEEIRKIIFNLRPMALDDLGLVPTLRKFVQDFEEKTKIRAVFETSGRELRMPSAMEAAVYRLVQEAFSNALKHASPTYVSLEMTFFPKRILIVIQDNGVGFDVEQTMARSKTSSHYGLIGMHERVELLNGKINIESARGQGTKITISIPVSTDL